MSYSANDNQNYFVQDGKTTSRVLSQPGGHCSLSIGTWSPEELQRSREAAEKKKAAAEAAIKEPENQAPSEIKSVNVEKVEQVVEQVVKKAEAPKVIEPQQDRPISSNAFASGANMNGPNVMTGRPSCRVLAPPGGHTSWSLG